MIEDKKTVRELFKKYKLFNKEISKMNFHLNVLCCNSEKLLKQLSDSGVIIISEEMEEKDVAVFLETLIEKCDMDNPNYDSVLDEEMTRIGMRTDRFYSNNFSNWNDDEYFDRPSGRGF